VSGDGGTTVTQALPSTTETTLVTTLGDVLVARGWMLVTAESCTGGLLAAAMTAVAGSSRWFERGFITYSNAAKTAHLGVRLETLGHAGAVSEACAREMALGALNSTPTAQLALSTTGIAGPGGATPGKPVGTVCFGFALRHARGVVNTYTQTQHFDGNRTQIRQAAVIHALRSAIQHLSMR